MKRRELLQELFPGPLVLFGSERHRLPGMATSQCRPLRVVVKLRQQKMGIGRRGERQPLLVGKLRRRGGVNLG